MLLICELIMYIVNTFYKLQCRLMVKCRLNKLPICECEI